LLREVGFQDVRRIFAAFPHQLSGGQRQRVSIAQGLACRPEVLIADEPTSSLDATAQEEILALLRELKGRLGMTMLFISHRPAILEALADRIVVMHGGRVVEEGPVRQILNHPAHLYTQTLLECDRNRQRFAPPGTPALAGRSVDPSRPWSGSEQPAPDRREQRALLRVCGLYKSYLQGRGLFGKRYAISALHGVDLEIPRGETLVLAGESGSGKSTLARCMAGLEKIDAGEVWLEGKTLARLGPRELAGVRRQVQLVFQDSAAALNPQMTAAEIVAEPLVIQKAGTPQEQRATALERMEQVGLARAWADRRPLEFSGGQRQRLAIARALTLHPKLLILDEALSGLDLLTQLQIVRLLQELQAKHQLTYLFITHDVGLAQRLGGEIVVMRDGQIVPRGADAPADAQPASKSVSPLAGRAIKPAEAG
jgi:ABC-type glutathione transport system ATPase component